MAVPKKQKYSPMGGFPQFKNNRTCYASSSNTTGLKVTRHLLFNRLKSCTIKTMRLRWLSKAVATQVLTHTYHKFTSLFYWCNKTKTASKTKQLSAIAANQRKLRINLNFTLQKQQQNSYNRRILLKTSNNKITALNPKWHYFSTNLQKLNADHSVGCVKQHYVSPLDFIAQPVSMTRALMLSVYLIGYTSLTFNKQKQFNQFAKFIHKLIWNYINITSLFIGRKQIESWLKTQTPFNGLTRIAVQESPYNGVEFSYHSTYIKALENHFNANNPGKPLELVNTFQPLHQHINHLYERVVFGTKSPSSLFSSQNLAKGYFNTLGLTTYKTIFSLTEARTFYTWSQVLTSNEMRVHHKQLINFTNYSNKIEVGVVDAKLLTKNTEWFKLTFLKKKIKIKTNDIKLRRTLNKQKTKDTPKTTLKRVSTNTTKLKVFKLTKPKRKQLSSLTLNKYAWARFQLARTHKLTSLMRQQPITPTVNTNSLNIKKFWNLAQLRALKSNCFKKRTFIQGAPTAITTHLPLQFQLLMEVKRFESYQQPFFFKKQTRRLKPKLTKQQSAI